MTTIYAIIICYHHFATLGYVDRCKVDNEGPFPSYAICEARRHQLGYNDITHHPDGADVTTRCMKKTVPGWQLPDEEEDGE
jgi:hypothetical protein